MQNRFSYQQLQPEDRMTIASMRQQDCSVRAMARTLRRSASTISRELGRNTVGAQAYGSHLAQQACGARQCAARPTAKLDVRGVAWRVVLTMLDWKWSPQQIAATLKRTFPNEPARHVSHETISTASTPCPGASCDASSSPACARAMARACRARAAMTGAARSPR